MPKKKASARQRNQVNVTTAGGERQEEEEAKADTKEGAHVVQRAAAAGDEPLSPAGAQGTSADRSGREAPLEGQAADSGQFSARIRTVLQAMGACQVTEDMREHVQRAVDLTHAQRAATSLSALNFSYLVDVDRESSRASVRFDVDTDDKVPQTLCLIELVIKACEEAGASLLEIELADSGHSLLLSVAPKSACVSIASPQHVDQQDKPDSLAESRDDSISLQDCSLVWFVSRSAGESRNVRILLEALGALEETLESKTAVREARRNLLRSCKNLSPTDLSFLTDLDEDTSSVSLRFDVGEAGFASTYIKVQLVLAACLEAGASSLQLELVDGACVQNVLVTLNGLVSERKATSKQYVFEREMDFNELRSFWAASSAAASNQDSVDDAEHGRHGGHEQISMSETADGLAGAERGVSLVANAQVRRDSVRKSLDISELAGLFGCDETQVCQQIALDGGNHEPSCGNDIEDENTQEIDRNRDQIVAQQMLGKWKKDIVPALGSARLLLDVGEEEAERQHTDAGVGRPHRSNTGRGMKGLSPSNNKISPLEGSGAEIENAAQIGSPFPVLGVRTVKRSRASRKAWQALPSVVTWTGRLKTYAESRRPTEHSNRLRVDVFYDILNVAARDWTAAVNSIGFWADSEQKTTTASSPSTHKQDVQCFSRSTQNRLEFFVENHATSGLSSSVRDSPDGIDEEEEKGRLMDRLKQIAQERMLHEERDERQQERDLSHLIQAARQREERGVEINLQSYDLMMTSRSGPHPHRQQKSGALSIKDFLSSPLSKGNRSKDTIDAVKSNQDLATIGKSEVAGAGLFGAFDSLPAIPPLGVPPFNLNFPNLDTLSSNLSPSKPGVKSIALKSIEDNLTQLQSPLQGLTSCASVVSGNFSGQQPSQSTSDASLKYFSKLKVTKVSNCEENTLGSRGSARSNDTTSSHNSEKDLSTLSDTTSDAKENAARLTIHKLAAENDTDSCSSSRAQHAELDAAKAAQDAATAANAAALEVKAALAQAQAEAQEIIRQSKSQADQMLKQAQDAAQQQAAAAEDILKRAKIEAQKITDQGAAVATATLAEATAKKEATVGQEAGVYPLQDQHAGREQDTHPLLPMFEVNFSLDSDSFMTRQQPFSAQPKTQQNEQRDVSRAISLATSLLEQGDGKQTDGSEEESSTSSNHSTSREAGQLIESSAPVSYGDPSSSDAPTQSLFLQQQMNNESIEVMEKQSAVVEERVTLDNGCSGSGGGGITEGKEGVEEVVGAGAWDGEGVGGLGYHFGHDADIRSQFEELDRIMATEQSETPQSLHQIVDTCLGSEHHTLLAATDLGDHAEEDDTSPHAMVPDHTDDRNSEISPFGTPVSRFETPGRQEPIQDMFYSDAGGTDGSMQEGVQCTEYSEKTPLESALNPLDSACSRRHSDAESENFPTWATPAGRTPNIPLTARVEGWGDLSLRNMLLLPRTPQPLMLSALPGAEETAEESNNFFHALQFPKLPDLPPLQIGGNVNLQIELPEPRVPELPSVFELPSVESFTASVETFTPPFGDTPQKSSISTFGDTPQKSKNREEVMAAIGEAQKDFGKLIGQAGSAIVSMLVLPAVGEAGELSPDTVPVKDTDHRVLSPQRSPDGMTAKEAKDPASFSTPSADKLMEEGHDKAVRPQGLPDAVPVKDADDPVSSPQRSPDGMTAKEAEDPASFCTPSAERSLEEGREEALSPKRHVIRNWKVPASGFARGTFLRGQDKGNTGWFDPEILPCSFSRQAARHDSELSARSTYSTHWVDDARTGEPQKDLQGICIGETPAVRQAFCEVHQISPSSPSPDHAEASAQVCPPAQMEEALQREFERRGLSTLMGVFVEYGIQQLEEMIVLLRSLTEQDVQEGSDFLSEISVPLTRFQIRILRCWWREIILGDGRPSHSI